jgi:hypothetical protein
MSCLHPPIGAAGGPAVAIIEARPRSLQRAVRDLGATRAAHKRSRRKRIHDDCHDGQ